MLEADDCGQLTEYHRKQAEHHMHLANWYVRVRQRLTGEQLNLPFPDRGD